MPEIELCDNAVLQNSDNNTSLRIFGSDSMGKMRE
jgi:hypothetical protein